MRTTHVTAFLLALAFAAQTHAAPTTRPAERWEYSTLLLSSEASFAGFSTDDGNISADSNEALYTKLGGPKRADKFSLIYLVNLLGRDGWEIIEIQKSAAHEVYWLKRRLP